MCPSHDAQWRSEFMMKKGVEAVKRWQWKLLSLLSRGGHPEQPAVFEPFWFDRAESIQGGYKIIILYTHIRPNVYPSSNIYAQISTPNMSIRNHRS